MAERDFLLVMTILDLMGKPANPSAVRNAYQQAQRLLRQSYQAEDESNQNDQD
jgi:hypothetical protein